ncbi:FUSC family protein [Pedomonas mirosovicensis]|uniref:FUSC family protein n=1 Tax=Pedomonas mirosovicensis TaxID=2908641 RepID=UPI002167496B|nr:FUSC family protein [Pedomonas mirosovicensis]MCH8685778.1 FUSC family protein [Pedomonas mirosovicensis]
MIRLRLVPGLFSLNTFIAAMMALFIALKLDMPNPYWAMLTVYIVSNPLAGALRSKAAFRLAGTIIGGAASVALVPNLVNAPELLCLAMALWIGVCLFVSLLDRTPRSYIFMLSGYTVALIGFPAVTNPSGIFDTAVARVEGIGLGIVCATLMHSLFLPQGLGGAVTQRIRGFMTDAQGWIVEMLGGQPPEHSSSRAHKLAADVSELHMLCTHLPFDISDYHNRSREVRALSERMGMLMPLATTVGDRLHVLQAQGRELPEASCQLVRDTVAWISAGPEAKLDVADELIARARALEPELGPSPEWLDVISASFHSRLRKLIEAYRDCRALSRSLVYGQPLPASVRPIVASSAAQPLHRDYGMALWSGVAAVTAMLAVCAFWIITGWSMGGQAAMMTAVNMCLFAASDDPSKGINTFAIYTALSIPLAGLYLFGIMPALHSFPMLALALAPVLLVCGYLSLQPHLFVRCLAILGNMFGLLGFQESFHPDFAAFANGSLAMLAGMIAASIVTQLIRSVGAEYGTHRLLRVTWRDLARLAGGLRLPSRSSWISRMTDRAGLLGPRLQSTRGAKDLVADALGELRVGLNVIILRRLDEGLTPKARQAVDALMKALEVYFRARAAGEAQPPEALLAALDRAIVALGAEATASARQAGLLALAGLRRTLFPDTLAFAGGNHGR